MPTEYIPASVPAMRDALRLRLDYAKRRLGLDIPNLHIITWVSFFWGATNGLLIGINDLQELRALLPPLGYDPTDFSKYPISPTSQAVVDSTPEDTPVWPTPARATYRDIVDGLHYYAGKMPDDDAVALYGYLRGQLESGSINESEHADLVEMLPVIENNPVDLIVESAEAAEQTSSGRDER